MLPRPFQLGVLRVARSWIRGPGRPVRSAEGSCPGGARVGAKTEWWLHPRQSRGPWSRPAPAFVLGDPRQCFWLWRLRTFLSGIRGLRFSLRGAELGQEREESWAAPGVPGRVSRRRGNLPATEGGGQAPSCLCPWSPASPCTGHASGVTLRGLCFWESEGQETPSEGLRLRSAP